MINRLLTTFSNNADADLGEKIGNFGLGLLRIGFGETYVVKENHADFTKEVHSTSVKVGAVALFILILPASLIAAGIGFVGMALSKSHERIFNAYEMFSNGKSAPKMGNSAHIDYINAPVARILVSAPKMENSAHIDLMDLPYKLIMDFGYLIPEPKSKPLVRRIPPVSMMDTVIGFDLEGKGISEHGSGEFFTDQEIIETCEVIKIETREGIEIHYTKHGKPIILQQATRGCTAATAAMLILDNEKEPNFDGLRKRNLGNDHYQITDIKNAQLEPLLTKAKDLTELRHLIIQNGSGVASVSGKMGGHVIVVDDVSIDLTQVRLRDPYHGWEITVGREAFEKVWHGGEIIQIQK